MTGSFALVDAPSQALKNARGDHCDLAGIIGRRVAAPVNMQLYV
jgi:hypothetical protein